MTKAIKNKQTDLAKWFLSKSSVELTGILLDLIGDYPNEEARFEFAMLNEQGGLSVAEINKLITKALPARAVWEWNKVAGYFQQADGMVDEVLLAIDKVSVSEQWQLILKMIIRLNKVLEKIDDSGGFRFYIEGQLNVRLTSLFNQLSWSDEKKAQWIFEHFKEYKYDVFPAVPEDFELTASVTQIFLSYCTQTVEQKLTMSFDVNCREDNWYLHRYTKQLIEAAKLKGDITEQCRLMNLTATSVNDYLKISQACLESTSQADNTVDAQYWLQQAYNKVETAREKLSCQQGEIALLLALKEHKKAWQLSWLLFTEEPSFLSYQKLAKLQETTGKIDTDFLKKTELVFDNCYAENDRGIAYNADALLDFYIEQGELNKARKWVLTHKAASSSLLQLADLIVNEYPQESIDLYYRVVNNELQVAKNSSYREALELLLELQKNLNGNTAPLYLMVKKVIQKHKAKRNLMKLLKAKFLICFD